MAVDSLRETRHINRIRAQDLSGLWTAQSYRPDITRALAAVRGLPNWLPLGGMCSQPIAQGRTPAYATDGSGYPCIKTKHITGLIVDDSEPEWVTQECALALSRFKVAQSTVLMNRSGAGSIGRCAVYLGNAAPLTNEHVLHIRVAAPHDPCFVGAYLSSWWGERAIEQGVTGSTGQLNLANEHVSRVPVPALNPVAQRYIGDKVRQADRLRNRACTVHASLQASASAFFGAYKPTPKGRSYRTGSQAIAGRIDAWFYNPRFAHAANAIEGAGIHLTELGKLAPGITNGGTPRGAVFGADGIRWIRGKDFVHGDIALDNLPLLDRASEQTIARSRTRRGDLLLSIKGTVGDVAVIDSQIEGCNINQDVARIPLGSETDAQFLALFLESELGQLLMERQIYGAINAFLSLENLRELAVPDIREVPSSVREQLASMRAEVVALRRASAVLISSSKLLIERLIDGRVTEADLVAAQMALEAGNRSPDRAILQALRPSDDPDAKPLIPDLDALYALLDEPDGEKG